MKTQKQKSLIRYVTRFSVRLCLRLTLKSLFYELVYHQLTGSEWAHAHVRLFRVTTRLASDNEQTTRLSKQKLATKIKCRKYKVVNTLYSKTENRRDLACRTISNDAVLSKV